MLMDVAQTKDRQREPETAPVTHLASKRLLCCSRILCRLLAGLAASPRVSCTLLLSLLLLFV